MTALSVATTFTLMCKSLSQSCERSCHSAVSCHRCHSAVSVTAVTHSAVSCHHYHTSVLCNVTALSLLQRCQFNCIANTLMLLPSLSQCYLGHYGHSTVKHTAVTILCHTSGNCYRCDSVDSSVSDSGVNRNRCATAVGFLVCIEAEVQRPWHFV